MTERAFIVAGLVFLFNGCAPEPEGAGELVGHWVSTLSSEFLGLTIEVQGDSLGGEAERMPDGRRVPYSLVGTTMGDSLRATMRSEDGETISVRGNLRGDTLYVRLTGDRYADRLVPLVKSSP